MTGLLYRFYSLTVQLRSRLRIVLNCLGISFASWSLGGDFFFSYPLKIFSGLCSNAKKSSQHQQNVDVLRKRSPTHY